MDSTAITDLLDRVMSDPDLEHRFTTAASADEVVALGRELGIDVDADALASHFTVGEMSEGELERVTGGAGSSGARIPVPPFWRP